MLTKIIFFIALVGIISCQFPTGETFRSGFIEIDESTNDKLFYWLFDSRNAPRNDPLVLWLTGGPGCSSELACLKENGPYRMKFGASELEILPEGWNDKANLLFVDQPLGTGFSTGAEEHYCTDEDCVAKDFFIFFKGFLERFTEFQGRPFFITGESYAGHYVPAISAYLKQMSYRYPKLGINLVASAIGNGLTDPYHQYPAYGEFAVKYGIIDNNEYQQVKQQLEYCQELIRSASPYATEECNYGLDLPCELYQRDTGKRLNVYDWKADCTGSLCYDFDNVHEFLNRAIVQRDLGVDSEHKTWESCDDEVHRKMMGDWLNDLSPKIKYLLTNDVHILIYAGELDYICNYMGNKAWTLALDWAYKAQFNAASDVPWPTKDGSLILSKNLGRIDYKTGDYGKLRTYDKLSFLQVFRAGHMVPMDQPQAAIIMLEDFFHAKLAQQAKYAEEL